MNVLLNGFDRKEVTFSQDATVKEGFPVILADKNTVTVPAKDKAFCGICTKSEDGYASVALKGYITVAFSGTAPVIGYNQLVSDGSGAVKAAQSGGREYLVADVDEATGTCGIILY